MTHGYFSRHGTILGPGGKSRRLPGPLGYQDLQRGAQERDPRCDPDADIDWRITGEEFLPHCHPPPDPSVVWRDWLLRLPLLVFELAGRRAGGPSVAEMVAGARQIWREANIEFITEIRRVDESQTRQALESPPNEPLVLFNSQSGAVCPGGAASPRTGFCVTDPPDLPARRTRQMNNLRHLKGSGNESVLGAFFVDLYNISTFGNADRARTQVYIKREQSDPWSATAFIVGRVLAHELGHILLSTGFHAGSGEDETTASWQIPSEYRPTSPLMRYGEDSVRVDISHQDAVRAHRWCRARANVTIVSLGTH